MSESAGIPETPAPAPALPVWQGREDVGEVPIQRPKKGLPAWLWALLGCSGCGCLMVPLLAAILFPVFAKAREKARQAGCEINQRQIYASIKMYSEDFDETFPPSKKWVDATYPYLKNEAVYRCPAEQESPYGYAFNSGVSGKVIAKLDPTAPGPLIYDSTANVRNATDAVKSLPEPGRHNRHTDVVTNAQGETKAVTTDETPSF